MTGSISPLRFYNKTNKKLKTALSSFGKLCPWIIKPRLVCIGVCVIVSVREPEYIANKQFNISLS